MQFTIPALRLGAALAALCLGGATSAAFAAGPRDALLARYAQIAQQENPAFRGFDAARGKALYLGPHTGGDNPKIDACASCHTENPRGEGRHVENRRSIEPMAVSANPERFTKYSKVEKRFDRDCRAVLGRACTATEKGDFIAFLAGQ